MNVRRGQAMQSTSSQQERNVISQRGREDVRWRFSR